jgi:ketosteroid isomerase-like protein
MRRCHLSFLCFLVMLPVILTACQKVEPDAHAEVLAVLRAAEDGWNRGDLEAYLDSYARDGQTRFAGRDQVTLGWEEVLTRYRAGYPDRQTMGQLAFGDLDVKLLGSDHALVFGRWLLRRGEEEPQGLFTLHLERRPEGWKIVHDHTSSGQPLQTAGTASIRSDELLEKVAYLSDRRFAGRLPGSPEYDQAARAMAERMAELGLQPVAEDGYFQHLDMEYNEVLPGCRLALQQPGTAGKEYVLDRDYIFRGFTGSGDVTAPVVFCGYGISLPERGYDDYAGVDVRGKIVLVFKQGPRWRLDDGESWGGLPDPRPKARTALDHGAVAVLMVSRPNDRDPQPLIGSVMHGQGDSQPDIPQLQISQEVAADLLAGTGLTLSLLQTRIDEAREPASLALDRAVHVKVNTVYDPARDTVNVVGMLPGSDPDLKDEYLIIGAHLDHVGTQAGQAFFPGANDNASGSASVMELAEAFTAAHEQPRRSVVFVLFAGEEQGLYGSRHFAENPPVPLDRTVAMFNLDCVAHGDSIQLGNGKSVPRLWSLARALDRNGDRLTVAGTWQGGGADGTPFHRRGVPMLYFVTRDSYTHLHRTTDTVQTLNGPLHEALTRLAYRTASAVAGGQYRREELAP